MSILFDLRPLQTGYAQRGIGTVVANIAAELADSPDAGKMLYCTYRHRHVVYGKAFPVTYPPVKAWFWEQLFWPLRAIRAGARVVHSTVSLGYLREIALPFFQPVPTIATVYDCTPFTYPPYAPVSRTATMAIQKRALKRCAAILTISEAVKKNLCDLFALAPERIHLLSCALDRSFRACAQKSAPSILPDAYLLTMGEAMHKDIAATIRLFDACCTDFYRGHLAIVGRKAAQAPKARAAMEASPFSQRIHFFENVDTPTLVSLYKNCTAFVSTTRAEGFGLGFLEALYCRAPVVASALPAVTEATGGHATLHSPDNLEHFKTTLQEIVLSPEHFFEQTGEGHAFAARTSWKNSVTCLRKLYASLGA